MQLTEPHPTSNYCHQRVARKRRKPALPCNKVGLLKERKEWSNLLSFADYRSNGHLDPLIGGRTKNGRPAMPNAQFRTLAHNHKPPPAAIEDLLRGFHVPRAIEPKRLPT